MSDRRAMLYSCALYLSSAKRSLVSSIASAARRSGVVVVDEFTDDAYARSSIKLVGETLPLLAAARAVAAAAIEQVDLREAPHPAPHPRVGALDMVAFMPLSEAAASSLGSELQECDQLATDLGVSIGDAGGSVLLFGPSNGRSLLETRRGTSFFKSVKADAPREPRSALVPDLGSKEVGNRLGVSIVGAMPYVTNFNLQVEGASLSECKAAAAALREHLGVQVMALPHAEGRVEIGCNLQATRELPSQSREAVLALVEAQLPQAARVSHAYVVGLTPEDAKQTAIAELQRNA